MTSLQQNKLFSKIGIGTTRLPLGDKRNESIDIIRYAIDSGMTFIDASRGYWDIELVLAKALKDGYREKVLLSSKWAPWMMKIEEDDLPNEKSIVKRIEDSLKRLEVDYLDFFLIWSQNNQQNFSDIILTGGMLDGLLKARERNLIKYIGYSSHDNPKNIVKNLEENLWADVIILSYNILNRINKEPIEVAHKKGVKTIVMNPLGGGSFLRNNFFMNEIAKLVYSENIAELALRYIYSNNNVDMILNGISNNVDIDSTKKAINKGNYNYYQLKLIEDSLIKIKKIDGFCTSCHYCMPCHKRIDIPSVMQSIFIEKYTGSKEEARLNYLEIKGKKADLCNSCGTCEKKCTQKLKIIEGMKHARETYMEL